MLPNYTRTLLACVQMEVMCRHGCYSKRSPLEVGIFYRQIEYNVVIYWQVLKQDLCPRYEIQNRLD